MQINAYIREIDSALGRIRSLYDNLAQEHEISSLCQTIYYFLYTEGAITQKRISEKCYHPKQTINNVIRLLQDSGKIVLELDENDRREKKIVLTQPGLASAREIVEPMIMIEEEVINRLGKERVSQFISNLIAYADVFEEVLNECEKSQMDSKGYL